MAITNTQSLYQFTLGSLNQALAYPVYFLDPSDITVVTTNPTTKVDTTLVLNNDYSVTGAGNQVGGTVTMAPGIIGNIVTIYLTPNLTQPTSFVENGAFSESTIEQTVDRLCMEIHELNNQLQRTLRLPNSNAVTTPFPVTSRLDGIPYFDSVTGALGLVTRQSIIIAAQTGTATVAAGTILGNDTGSAGGPLALTPIRVRSLAFANAFGLVGGAFIDKTTNLVNTAGKLDTAQDIRSDSFVNFGQVTLDSSSTTATNLIFENDSGSKIWYVRLKGSAANVDNFELYNATDGITGLRLLVTGQPQFPFFGTAGVVMNDATGKLSTTASPTFSNGIFNGSSVAVGSAFTPTAWGTGGALDINGTTGGLLAFYYGGTAKGYFLAQSAGGFSLNTQGAGSINFNINANPVAAYLSSGLEVTGSIKTSAPSGGTAAAWKVGTYTGGTVTHTGTVRIDIAGTPYDVLVRL